MSQVAPGPRFMNGPNIIFLKAKHQDEPKQVVQTVLTSNLLFLLIWTVLIGPRGFIWTWSSRNPFKSGLPNWLVWFDELGHVDFSWASLVIVWAKVTDKRRSDLSFCTYRKRNFLFFFYAKIGNSWNLIPALHKHPLAQRSSRVSIKKLHFLFFPLSFFFYIRFSCYPCVLNVLYRYFRWQQVDIWKYRGILEAREPKISQMTCDVRGY